MNKSKVLNFLEGYNPNLITVNKFGFNKNGVKGMYKLSLKKNNREVSNLFFSIVPFYEGGLLLKIESGETPRENNRGKGYGTLLRALATKAGQIAGAKIAMQFGVNNKNRSVARLARSTTAKPMPTSTGILVERLGWTPTNVPGFNTLGRVKSIPSKFNYTTNNIAKVNRYLEKSRVRSPGCTRCSIQ
jgi:hypothetical protein